MIRGLLLSVLLALPLHAGDSLLELLDAANLGPQDLAFDLLPQENDSLRLEIVDAVLKEGLRLDQLGEQLGADLEAIDLMDDLYRRLEQLRLRKGEAVSDLEPRPLPAGGARIWRKWLRDLHELAAIRLLPEDELAILEEDLSSLLADDPDRPELNVFELDSLERLGRAEALARKRRLEQARLPERALLRDALGRMDRLFLDLSYLKAVLATRKPFEDERYGRLLHADDWLLIGDTGPNRYLGKLPPIVIDLGGDDVYGAEAAVSRGGISLLIDLEGADRYQGDERHGPASTVGGCSVLLDLAGDDLYEGASRCQGAALGGVAFLIDQQGDDRYHGQLFCQGAASLGVAALVDGDGQDLYTSSLYSQGFGHLAGTGLLQDMAGHDQYLLLPRFLDQIRYEDHHVTLGQGFGFGQRPDLSGGVGVLHDLEGNDSYSADIYGQGAAYWWSLGFLLDRAGNDRYAAWQYAQGAGVHLAGGALLDDAGLDVYQSRGVSQGCGHDLAIGLLRDRAGDDSYLAWDLSQAAGSANGTGILLDEAGSDLYAMRGMRKHRAYGDPRRRTGSLGLFGDFDGQDHYLGHGGEDRLWSGSFRGFGLDRQRDAAHEATSAAVEVATGLDPLFNPNDDPARLYVWAIRLEPRWSAERDEARRLLVEQPEALIQLVEERSLLASRISWERHALKDLLKGLGAKALPLYHRAMAAELNHPEAGDSLTALRSARGMVLWVLGEQADVGDADLFSRWWSELGDDLAPGLRSQLLENLAIRTGGGEELLEGLQDGDSRVRRSSAWGLGRLASTPQRRSALVQSLSDPASSVRLAAARSLELDSLLTREDLETELQARASGDLAARELFRLLRLKDPDAARAWLARHPDDSFPWERLELAEPGE